MKKTVICSLIAASLINLGGLHLGFALSQGPPAHAVAPPCPEYTPGRVLAGELQKLTCDVSPPQKLDLVMDKNPRRNPKARCDKHGGHFHQHRNGTLRCNGVDY